ncbi:hypothetical protein ABT75_04640 [Salmonella enterica subsp. enterica serovar Typhimurium]|nr:hypothetical protein ABT75_04640 [Salmonella enterica subsp. enterica serovar Typhimurium]
MNPFKGRHFQRDIILWAVRWYCKYGISYRELQEMLAERGVNVDHSTIYRSPLWPEKKLINVAFSEGCFLNVVFRALLQIVGGDKLIIPFC